jgi:hypothetical protein
MVPLPLEEYVPPGKDGCGARFIFLRELDGQPFITKDTGEVRFYAEFAKGQRSTGALKLPKRKRAPGHDHPDRICRWLHLGIEVICLGS